MRKDPFTEDGPLSRLRDLLYDSVYHVGDTGLQCIADLIHGPDSPRLYEYETRQLNKRARAGETPLNREERHLFSELLKRHDGETLTDYWKRRKAHLATPDKVSLVEQYRQLRHSKERADYEGSKTASDMKKRALEAEFRHATKNTQSARHGMRGRS